MLVRITRGPLCYGIEVKRGIVTDAAPVAKWMVGKEYLPCRRWLLAKRAEIEELKG